MTHIYCFVAAKSAGHILPALALAKNIKQQEPSIHILFISTTTALDKKLLCTNSDIDEHIGYQLDNIPYRKPWRIPLFAWQLLSSFVHCFSLFCKERPRRIITTGGLIAIPACIAGWLLGIPIDLYELNAEPGGAIKFLAPIATNIYYCFDECAKKLPKKKRLKTAYPLYSDLTVPAAMYQELKFDSAKKTLFILGGSQGSTTLNNAIKQSLLNDKSLAASVNIIHQMGAEQKQLEAWNAWYETHHISAYVFTYEPCVPYYKLADVVICRSGAGTLFELEALHKKYITIPLETKSTHHQVENARAMERKHPDLVCVLTQQEIVQDTHALAHVLKKLLY